MIEDDGKNCNVIYLPEVEGASAIVPAGEALILPVRSKPKVLCGSCLRNSIGE